MRRSRSPSLINGWVILLGIIFAVLLIAITAVIIVLTSSQGQAPADTGGGMTVIPAPTSTMTPTVVIHTPTATNPPAIDGIYVGAYVQISGTDGQGLRLRAGPGTTNEPLFLGMDAEVFQVKEGPMQADGFTWWFLEANYDPNRSGWAAADYLSVVTPAETPTP